VLKNLKTITKEMNMTTVSLQGNAFDTVGELPKVGETAPAFSLVQADLSEVTLASFAGKRVVLNIFPSVDTGTCATSVRKFNEQAADLNNAVVVCVSADLPFALGRFCGAEGIENVSVGSTFRASFGSDYGVSFKTGPLAGLLSRSVVVIDETGKVIHAEQVAETVDEPDYEAALATLAV
jgi:thiol peroxidase